MIGMVFCDQNFQTVLIYLDDILIPACSIAQMLERIDMVFSRLEKVCLKVKPDKCHFFKSSLKFLGHIVSEDGIATDPEKIRAVEEWPLPTTADELKTFLGLTGYYRRFVDGYSKLAKPLHSIANLKKRHKFQDFWTEDCTLAFETLKQKLVSAPLLGYPDFSIEFVLEIDASFHGLSAVLSQQQDHGLVVISYASRGLRKHERNMNNYSSMKLELLALYWAVTVKFRDLLIGSKFVVFTDNNPLSYVQRLPGLVRQKFVG